jgi:hypothetical protein
MLQTISAVPFAFGQETPAEIRIPISLAGRPMPVFQNGFLGSIDSDRRTIHVVDREGRLAGSCYITVPDSSVSLVYGVAISPQKTIVALASAKDDSGRIVSLLVYADFSGKMIRAVRTTPFAAGRNAVFFPDGRLLCIGREYDSQFEDVDGHSILRIYSESGILLNKALKVDMLRPNKRELHPLNWLTALGRDRLGLLDKENLRYTEVFFNGSIARPLTALGISSPFQVNGMALLANGDRLVSVQKEGVLALYRIADGADGQPVPRAVSSPKPPEGTKGFMVLGAANGQVALLAMPDRLVLSPETIL